MGPLAGSAIERFGAAGLVGRNLVIFVGFGALWSRLETPGTVAVPLALASVGAAVTVWNTLVILAAF